MATNFRRTKLERFVKRLEEELPDIEENKNNSDPYGMGLYYDGIISTQTAIIKKLKREFNLKENEQ